MIGYAIADFASASTRLVIEVDGDTHVDPKRDEMRDQYLRSLGYRVVHVRNEDVMKNLEGVLDAILAAAKDRVPHPNPSPEGEGRRRDEPVAFAKNVDVQSIKDSHA